jgi:hypothetical protein
MREAGRAAGSFGAGVAATKLSSLWSVSMDQQAMPSAPSLTISPVSGLNTSTPFTCTRCLPSGSSMRMMSGASESLPSREVVLLSDRSTLMGGV